MSLRAVWCALLLAGCGAAVGEGAAESPVAAAVPDGSLPWQETGIPRVRVPLEGAPSRGADAPLVTIVVFSDFECSYCGDLAPTLDRLLEAYPDTVRLYFRHLPLPFHPHAELAAIAAEEARAQRGDAGFWAMHDRLFAHQDALDLDGLVRHAMAIGLEAERFRIALRGRVHAAALEQDVAIADRVGADGTPILFLNGRSLSGARPLEELRLAVDRELDLARQALSRGVPRARVYEAAMRDALATAPRRPEPEGPPPSERPTELDRDAIYRVPVDGAPTLGPADAPVTIVTFSEFQCPFCERVQPTLRELMQRYPEQIRLVFRHNPLPFHVDAEPAAMAAMEARAQRGDAGFWAMHDVLFANQGALSFDELLGHASQVGLDLPRFRRALEDGVHEASIDADAALARQLGARGTPTFYINGRILTGAQPLPAFVAAVDDALARAAAERSRGTPAVEVYAALTRDGATEARMRAVAPPVERASIPAPASAPRRGAAQPRLVIQMFTDFECPFCARVVPTVERLLAAHPEVQLVFRHYPRPFHSHATDASIAAIEVQRQLGDEGFWRMYALLFENTQALERADLVRYAGLVGADPARVAAALESAAHLPTVAADQEAIAAAGLRIGTPAFLIGDRLFMGAQPYEEFEAALREALGPAN